MIGFETVEPAGRATGSRYTQMSDSDVVVPDPDGVPKTSDQLQGKDREQDASAQEKDQAPETDDESLQEEESEDVTAGGVAGQAGVGNG